MCPTKIIYNTLTSLNVTHTHSDLSHKCIDIWFGILSVLLATTCKACQLMPELNDWRNGIHFANMLQDQRKVLTFGKQTRMSFHLNSWTYMGKGVQMESRWWNIVLYSWTQRHNLVPLSISRDITYWQLEHRYIIQLIKQLLLYGWKCSEREKNGFIWTGFKY